jgi:hypothetical protein
MAPPYTPIWPNGRMEAWQLSENVRKKNHLRQWKICRALGGLAHRQVLCLPRPIFERWENWGDHFDPKFFGPFSFSHYFDSSLLKDEKGRIEMLQAWEGELPKPLSDSEWAPWLEAATIRKLAYNARLEKERRRLRAAQVRTHDKKIQLAEE